MNKIEWNEEINNNILQFNNSTIQSERNILFRKFHKQLEYLIDSVIHINYNKNFKTNQYLTMKYAIKNDIDDYNDIKQELLLFLIEKIIPLITPERKITTQNYIFICLMNKYINLMMKRYNYKVTEIPTERLMLMMLIVDDIDDKQLQLDFQIDIIDGLDEMIVRERKVNKSNTIFLLLLRKYLIENNFDAREFNTYCIEKMKIKQSTFNMIASRLKIRTPLLNERFIHKKYYS